MLIPALILFNLSMESTPPTIDLISIAFVSDDDREYYAISKDFNLKEAWNRYDEKVEIVYGDMRNRFPEGRKYKDYWIRENVLFPIYYELCLKDNGVSVHEYGNYNNFVGAIKSSNNYKYVYKNLKRLIAKYGKSNKQIAEEVKTFIYNSYERNTFRQDLKNNPINLFGYYSSYDHVCLSWLYGKMINLPDSFPMYTIDLKQMLDEKVNKLGWELNRNISNSYTKLINVVVGERCHDKDRLATFEEKLNKIKSLDEYPKETNSHNALADARWNKKLHQFTESL